MYSQAKKAKENKSRTIANSAAKNHNRLNRDHLKTNSRFNSNVIEFRLEKDKFNIAGELHPQKNLEDFARTKEKEMCSKIVGGGYWREYEIKINDTFADPPYLRAKHNCYLFILHMDKELPQYVNPRARDTGKLLSDIKDMDFTKKALDYLNQSTYELKRLPPETLKNKDKLIELINGCLDIFLGLTSGNKSEFDSALEALAASIRNMSFNELSNLGTQRSTGMTEAIKQSLNMKGVWKVGNNHIPEIDKLLDEDTKSKIAITNENDFEQEMQDHFINDIESYRIWKASHSSGYIKPRTMHMPQLQPRPLGPAPHPPPRPDM